MSTKTSLRCLFQRRCRESLEVRQCRYPRSLCPRSFTLVFSSEKVKFDKRLLCWNFFPYDGSQYQQMTSRAQKIHKHNICEYGLILHWICWIFLLLLRYKDELIKGSNYFWHEMKNAELRIRKKKSDKQSQRTLRILWASSRRCIHDITITFIVYTKDRSRTRLPRTLRAISNSPLLPSCFDHTSALSQSPFSLVLCPDLIAPLFFARLSIFRDQAELQS